MCAASNAVRFGGFFLGWTGMCFTLDLMPHAYYMPPKILNNEDIADPTKVKVVVSKKIFNKTYYEAIPLNKTKTGKISEADVLAAITNPGNMSETSQHLWMMGWTLAESAIYAGTYTHISNPKWIARAQPNLARAMLIRGFGAWVASIVLEESIGHISGIPDFARNRVFFKVARGDKEENPKSFGDIFHADYEVRVTHPDVSVKSDSFF